MLIMGIDPGTKGCGIALTRDLQNYNYLYIKFNKDVHKLKKELSRLICDTRPTHIILGNPPTRHIRESIKKLYLPILSQISEKDGIQLLLVEEDNTTKLALNDISMVASYNTPHKYTEKEKRRLKKHGIIDVISAKLIILKAHEKGLV